MTIKPATYYEAFCDAPEHRDDGAVELCGFTAFRDPGHVADQITDRDGLVCADGRVFCSWECRPADVCPDADDNVHVFGADGVCTLCDYEPAAPTEGQETTE